MQYPLTTTSTSAGSAPVISSYGNYGYPQYSQGQQYPSGQQVQPYPQYPQYSQGQPYTQPQNPTFILPTTVSTFGNPPGTSNFAIPKPILIRSPTHNANLLPALWPNHTPQEYTAIYSTGIRDGDLELISVVVGRLRTSAFEDVLKSLIEAQQAANGNYEKFKKYILWKQPQVQYVQSDVDRKMINIRYEPPTAPGFVKCKFCGSDKVTVTTTQTRSGDEPLTTFYTCMNCGKKTVS